MDEERTRFTFHERLILKGTLITPKIKSTTYSQPNVNFPFICSRSFWEIKNLMSSHSWIQSCKFTCKLWCFVVDAMWLCSKGWWTNKGTSRQEFKGKTWKRLFVQYFCFRIFLFLFWKWTEYWPATSCRFISWEHRHIYNQ